MAVFELTRGTSPVILAFPHTGTDVPPDIRARLNDNGLLLADTDWHIHELYAGLLPDATTVRATFHRYVIDSNRGPEDESLYPGQNTTGLVPFTDFDGHPIWTEEPSPEDDGGVTTFHYELEAVRPGAARVTLAPKPAGRESAQPPVVLDVTVRGAAPR